MLAVEVTLWVADNRIPELTTEDGCLATVAIWTYSSAEVAEYLGDIPVS